MQPYFAVLGAVTLYVALTQSAIVLFTIGLNWMALLYCLYYIGGLHNYLWPHLSICMAAES